MEWTLLVLLFCFLSFIARLLLIYNKTLFEINELLVAWNWKRDLFWRADRKLQGCFFFNLDAISSLSHCFWADVSGSLLFHNIVGQKKVFVSIVRITYILPIGSRWVLEFWRGLGKKIGSTYLESCEKFPKEWESEIMEKTQSLDYGLWFFKVFMQWVRCE